MTKEQLAAANAALKAKAVKIRGKDYIQVKDRVAAFREAIPDGTIHTEIMYQNEDRVIMKATIIDRDGVTIATGYAEEVRAGSQINRTSYIENCETSAVGRALAFCGIGIIDSIASSEEVERADMERMENLARQPIGEIRAGYLLQELENVGIAKEFVCDLYGVKELHLLTERQHQNIIENEKKILKLYKESQK